MSEIAEIGKCKKTSSIGKCQKLLRLENVRNLSDKKGLCQNWKWSGNYHPFAIIESRSIKFERIWDMK